MTTDSQGSFPPPIVLQTHQPEPYEGSVEQAAGTVCEDKCWADIIYITGTGDFWLLTHEVAEALHEASDELAEWVLTEDPEQRIRHLAEDAGLIECFLPAHPENFLNRDERNSAREKLERLAELLNADRKEGEEAIDAGQRVSEYRPLLENGWLWLSPLIVSGSYAWDRLTRPEETRLISELHALYQTGTEKAKEAGYVIDGGHYFGPWESEIEQALEVYRQCRERVIRDVVSVSSPGMLIPVREALTEYQAFLADCESMSPVDSSRCEVIGDYFRQSAEQLDEDVSTYQMSILTLATLGVATPEWALADATTTSMQGRLSPGINGFDYYNDVLKQAADLFGDVESKLSQWATATARNANLPLHLFNDERNTFQRLTRELDALYELAEAQVEQMTPQRVLFWQADIEDHRHALGYTRQSIDVLVRDDFPLREFSSPMGSRSLSHISLRHLMRDMPDSERNTLERQLKQDGILPATLWEAKETALTSWLAQRGCERLQRQAEWFEEPLGFFQPHHLYAALDAQGHTVESLQDESAKTGWQDTLKKIIFTGPSREKLRLFDASAQAQMLRLVGMPHSELNEALGGHFEDTVALIERNATLQVFELEEVHTSAGVSTSGRVQQRHEAGTQRNIGGPNHQHWHSTHRPGSGKANISGGIHHQLSIKGTFSLARGAISLGTLHLPEEANAQPLYAVLRENGGEQRNLGRYSLQVSAVAKGFAGASLALTAQTGLSFDHQGIKITGTEWAKREAEGAALKAFAGATLGVQTNCSLRWQPPMDLTSQLPQLADQDWLTLSVQQNNLEAWRSLGKAVLGLEANGGIGGELGMRLGLHQGKFIAYTRAKVVAGAGVGGQIAIELDLQQLNLWMMMLSQALRDNNYGFVDWVDADAFEGLGYLSYLATTTLLDVGLLAARGIDGIKRLYELMTQSDRAGLIAYAIVDASNNPQTGPELSTWVQHLPPEALGPLLNTLITPPGWRGYTVDRERFDRGQAIDLQQIAIASCLEWLERGYLGHHYTRDAAQQLFERAVAKMTPTGRFDSDAAWVEAYCHNREALDAFMRRNGRGGPASVRAQDNYRQISRRLGTDIDEYRETYSTRRGTRVRYREH
ncbi:hypothetical protein [Vreelandella olivaria]|uniref:hypothetical protein n=1 Tax=Vreelandella olivaria TaxID=390919 RepID=UPI00201EEDA5|nr:hypothetical protein [Halomonas olivaria]